MLRGTLMIAVGVASAARVAAADQIVASHPAPLPVRQVRDRPYYEGRDADPAKHRLDLYLPIGPESVPALMWIHGGAWVQGGRAEEEDLATRFAERGIVVVAIDHRLSPGTWLDPSLTEGAQHPAHAIDCARAFAWLRANADGFGIDPSRLFVGGYSSGGHLAALLATDPRYLQEVGVPAGAIRAAVPIAAAYDLEAYYADHLRENGRAMADGHVLGVFGDEDALEAASPTAWIEGAATPMLVVSELDTYAYTKLFEDTVRATARNDIEFLHVRNHGHAGLYAALSRSPEDPTLERIIDYVARMGAPAEE